MVCKVKGEIFSNLKVGTDDIVHFTTTNIENSNMYASWNIQRIVQEKGRRNAMCPWWNMQIFLASWQRWSVRPSEKAFSKLKVRADGIVRFTTTNVEICTMKYSVDSATSQREGVEEYHVSLVKPGGTLSILTIWSAWSSRSEPKCHPTCTPIRNHWTSLCLTLRRSWLRM